ncbi:hypothetical protein NJC40_16395 [Pseudomonas sp. 21LCFQ02]|uniref:hypothetical protein n=1 Tax=Pseudomonas sp. 21LCFQ02 TaxID=2957505 RepID=UPI00209AA15F|nr:hypothetical protein [Pseudomonas sp. 21LCFQ02]MCO8169347.1 hypothetical protein [Pseudomonas sp. 21LCFQ02]
MHSPIRHRTFCTDALPNLSPRPLNAADHTGKRRGTMTAIAWYRASRSGKGTLWLCRCDCGLYEYRRPGTWGTKRFPDDQCQVCQRNAQGPNASDTAPARLQQWTDKLRCLGLSDEEIGQIRAIGANVDTRGQTLEQIREQLARIGI